MGLNLKWCRDCGEWKPLTDFTRARANRDGRGPYCRPCHRVRNVAWNRANPERHAAMQRRASLKALYGITAAEYDALLAKQDGGCAICGSTESNGRSAYFHVDHNHETGEVRGLLCANCNVGIGHFREDPELLMRALAYLRV